METDVTLIKEGASMIALRECFKCLLHELNIDGTDWERVWDCNRGLTEESSLGGKDVDNLCLKLHEKLSEIKLRRSVILSRAIEALVVFDDSLNKLVENFKNFGFALGVLEPPFKGETDKDREKELTAEREKSFEWLATEWAAFRQVTNKLLPELCTALKSSVKQVPTSSPSVDECLEKIGSSQTLANCALPGLRAVVFESPGPVTRTDKRGVVRLRMMDADAPPPVVVRVTLKDAAENGSDYHSVTDQYSFKRTVAARRGSPDVLEATIDFNGRHKFKLDLKRKKTMGASAKLYRIAIEVRHEDGRMQTYLTLPFAVTTNASQKPEGWCAVFWNRAFPDHDGRNVPWPLFFDKLSVLFETLTGKGLGRSSRGSNHQEAGLLSELKKNREDSLTFSELAQLDFHEEKSSRWQWIFSYLTLLLGKYGEKDRERPDLLHLWREGKIWGFTSKHFMVQELSKGRTGRCMLRFRNGKQGEIVLCCQTQPEILQFNWSKDGLEKKKSFFVDLLLEKTPVLKVDDPTLVFLSESDERQDMSLADMGRNLDGREERHSLDEHGYISGFARNEEILPLIEQLLDERRSRLSESGESRHLFGNPATPDSGFEAAGGDESPGPSASKAPRRLTSVTEEDLHAIAEGEGLVKDFGVGEVADRVQGMDVKEGHLDHDYCLSDHHEDPFMGYPGGCSNLGDIADENVFFVKL